MIAFAVLTTILFAAPAVPPPQAHFSRAQKLFSQGRYKDALEEFTAATEAASSEIPELWFNIGQCHRNLGHARQAVASFRRYLSLNPDAPDREQVVAMIGRLGGTVDDLQPVRVASLDNTAIPTPAPVIEPAPAPVSEPVVVAPAQVVIPALAPAPPEPPAPPPAKPRRWKIWVGVVTGITAAAAVGVGLGVGLGVRPTQAAAPMLGTTVTLDTRGK